MTGKRFRKWLGKWLGYDDTSRIETELLSHAYTDVKNKFSPLTYQNPYLSYMDSILECVLKKKGILFRDLKLVIFDAETDKDDRAIQTVLSKLSDKLNYLLIITNRPYEYQNYIDAMFMERGLIVQQVPKAECRRVQGNLILDFERSGNISLQDIQCADAIYMPIYKKPWEICENLDIVVPVGYNTLVVDGICLPQSDDCKIIQECLFEEELDRLDREFRKG